MGWGNGNLGGGSGGLNFKVVGGTTAPSNPKDNTIWVNTNVPITGWTFSATQPEAPADGKDGPVWFQTSAASTVEFNALKKNVIQVYPVSASQYISGEWAAKTAKSWQYSKWADWWNGELYQDGNEYTAITGGWIGTPKGYASDANTAGTPTITRGEEAMTMQMATLAGAMIHTAKKIDLTDYSTLVFDGIVTGATAYASQCNFRVWSDIGTYSTSNAVATETIQRNVDGEVTLDISGLRGEYYVGFGLWTKSPVVVMRSLKMK